MVVALNVEIPHPLRQRAGLRPRTVSEERARRTRPGSATRLGLNGSPQPLQERPDFPVQLMVLHVVFLSSSESHFGFSVSLIGAAHNSYRSLKIKAVERTLEKQWKNRGAL